MIESCPMSIYCASWAIESYHEINLQKVGERLIPAPASKIEDLFFEQEKSDVNNSAELKKIPIPSL